MSQVNKATTLLESVIDGDTAEVKRVLKMVESLEDLISYPGECADKTIEAVKEVVEYLSARVGLLNSTADAEEIVSDPCVSQVSTLEHLIEQAKERNSPERALKILEGYSARIARLCSDLEPAADKLLEVPANSIPRSIALVDEMLAVPGHDPALGHIRNTLQSLQVPSEIPLAEAVKLLDTAVNAHPLDIDQTSLFEVQLLLRDMVKMPGADNLGKPGYVVVVDPRGLTDEIIDSLNGFMIAYGTGQHDCKSLRLQAALAGDRSMNVLPKWFAQTYGHVSKGGFTALCYHVLIESQVNPRFKNEPLMLSHEELEKLELRLIAGDKQAFTKALEQK